MAVARLVELGDIRVHEPRGVLGEQRAGDREALGDAVGRHEASAPQRRPREAGRRVLARGDHDGVDSRVRRAFKQGGLWLPALGIGLRIPPGQQVEGAVVLYIVRGVADEPVLAGRAARRQGRERRRRCRWEGSTNDAATPGKRGHEVPGVAAAGREGLRPEAVDEDDGGRARGAELQRVTLAANSRKAARQHVAE